MMRLSEIRDLLLCEAFTGHDLETVHIAYGCASDMMSDVLAFSRTGAVLLTGLVNVQTVHTAFVADISAVVFVRGKRPDQAIIDLAQEKGIPLLGTAASMYEAAAILHNHGLAPTMECAALDNAHRRV